MNFRPKTNFNAYVFGNYLNFHFVKYRLGFMSNKSVQVRAAGHNPKKMKVLKNAF